MTRDREAAWLVIPLLLLWPLWAVWWCAGKLADRIRGQHADNE